MYINTYIFYTIMTFAIGNLIFLNRIVSYLELAVIFVFTIFLKKQESSS